MLLVLPDPQQHDRGNKPCELFYNIFHKCLPRKIRGLPRGRQRGVTFGESHRELRGFTCGDPDFGVPDFRVPLLWHFLQRSCWS